MKKELNLMITPAEFPVPLIILPETDSTNNYLTQLCNEQQSAVREFTTVIAERQTAGKGQRGNSWESEDCRNITFSFVLYPTFIEARRQFILSQIVSLSIKEELDQWTEGISIKWPNDIYWNEKKICGILIENDLSGHHIGRSISGIGVNINQDVFRSNAPNPISLKTNHGKRPRPLSDTCQYHEAGKRILYPFCKRTLQTMQPILSQNVMSVPFSAETASTVMQTQTVNSLHACYV